MTAEQLNGWYWESFRVEARRRLRDLEDRLALTDSKILEELRNQLQERAYPVDPEADGDFGRDDIRMVKGLLGQQVKEEEKKDVQGPRLKDQIRVET